MYFCITGQIHVRACRKNLTFPNYEFGKGQYGFNPMKLSRFREKKLSWSEIPKFHKADPYKLGQMPLDQQKNLKVALFWRVLDIQT